MSILRIRLLGDFQLSYAGQPVVSLNPRVYKPSLSTWSYIATLPNHANIWLSFSGRIRTKRKR